MEPPIQTKTKNANLHAARKAKQDEFYTQLGDIEAEVRHYVRNLGQPDEVNPFRDKVVLLNCDDPQTSNFWVFFARQFDRLGLRQLISTHYEPGGEPSYAMFLDRDEHGQRVDHGVDARGVELGRIEPLIGNGDFRSPECLALLALADVVVTNPPFSLFREYLQTLVEHGKDFLVIGNLNAITTKAIWPLVQDSKLWWGPSITSGDRKFHVPDDYPLEAAGCGADPDGRRFIRVKGVRWYTNIDHPKRHDQLDLVKRYAEHEDEYPRYDNYDAINVDKVALIPCDYPSVMGVPITFLDKYNPRQFEILGCSYGYGRPAGWPSDIRMAPVVGGRDVYKRILIRNLYPELAGS